MSKLGKKIIYHLLKYDDGMEVIGEKGITEDYFLFEARDAYKYVRDNILKGRKPTINEVESKLKEKLKAVDKGDIEYLTEDIRKRYVNSKINPHLEEAIKHIESSNPQEAIKELLQVGEYSKHLDNRTTLHGLKADGDDRFEEYLETKFKKGIKGIPSRWKEINESCGGFVDGEFTVIAAFTNVGKTWALCIVAVDMIMALDKVDNILVVSTEMQPLKVARRVECVQHRINFKKMRKGELDTIEEDDWMQIISDAMDDKVEYAEANIVGKKDCNNVEKIKMFVKETGAKAILVDGGYRLDPSQQVRIGAGHEKQVVVIRELQEACIELNIPLVVTTQIGEVDEKKQGGTGNTYRGMKYAKEWMIDPDNVFLLKQTEEHKAEKRMVFTNGKLREGDRIGQSWQTHWDPDKMNYDDLTDADIYKPAGVGTAVFDDDDDTPPLPPTPSAVVIP